MCNARYPNKIIFHPKSTEKCTDATAKLDITKKDAADFSK
jgi:hypothetical protein